MNRPAPKTLRRLFFVALGHAIHVTWPVLSAILAAQLALGLLTGFVEGWSFGDAVYFTFITGLTIGYGDLVPRQALTPDATIKLSERRSPSLGGPLVSPGFAGCHVPADRRQRITRQRCSPAVLFRRLSDETIFQSLRSRPEIITRGYGHIAVRFCTRGSCLT
jgi:hypothetical protein